MGRLEQEVNIADERRGLSILGTPDMTTKYTTGRHFTLSWTSGSAASSSVSMYGLNRDWRRLPTGSW